MQKQYLKLNINDEHLSLGNFFRIIKDLSKNKTNALQTDLFCMLFDIYDVNDTTVNNYCVGIRSIGNKYKQIFIDRKNKYEHNKNIFTDTIINILNVIEGKVNIVNNPIEFINNNETLSILATKLYNLSKNDKQVTLDFSDNLNRLINEGNIYECLIEYPFGE